MTDLSNATDDDLNAERKRRKQAAKDARRADRRSLKERWNPNGEPYYFSRAERDRRKAERDARPAKDGRSKFAIVGLVALAIMALVVAGFFGSLITAQSAKSQAAAASAEMSQQLSEAQQTLAEQQQALEAAQAESDELQDQIESLETNVSELETQVAQVSVDSSAEGNNSPPVQQLSGDENAIRTAITADLGTMGWSPDQFTFNCDASLDPIERGDSAFSDGTLDSPAEIAQYLNSGTPGAQAQVEALRSSLSQEDFDRVMRGEGFTCVQFADSAIYQGNSYFRNGEYHFTESDYVVNPGDRVWVYTNVGNEVVREGSIRADCGNGHVSQVVPNTTDLPPVPVETPPAPPVDTFVPPGDTPPGDTPPGTPPVECQHDCTPPPAPQYVERCDLTTKLPVTITEEQAQDTTRYVPVDSPLCKPEEEQPEDVQVCDIETGDTITVPSTEADNEGYAPVGSPLCEDTPEQPVKVDRCDITTGKTVKITEEEAQDTNRYKPVGAPECQPPVTPVMVERCDTTTGSKVTITEEQAQDTTRYKDVNAPECNPTPPPTDECPEIPGDQPPGTDCNPPPPPVEDKCPDEEGVQDGFCGTPDEGAEQQPVQDNDPSQVAPTPGYDPGAAEDNSAEQGDCAAGNCGTDPTQSGTEVIDSGNGGGAPGGETVTPDQQPAPSADPAPAPQPNPDYDGSQPTQNPDAGTSDPEDTAVVSDPVVEAGSDPLADMDLPNVDG